MTVRAEKFMDIFYKHYPHLDKHDADLECVCAIIRECAERFCTDWGELEHPYDVLHEIADEIQSLQKC